MRRPPRRTPPQPALPWPAVAVPCPRCHGTRQVYHRATPPGVEILGGKRVPFPACLAVGTVQAPLSALVADAPAGKPRAAGA